MYESPINIILGDMQVSFDNEIVKAVRKYDVSVDKDELIKAMSYDRNQYEKGYEDGRKASPQWIPCSDRLPERMADDDNFIIWNLVCCSSTDISIGYFDPDQKEWFVKYPAKADDVIAWMQLPKPYKENEVE